MAGLNIAEKRLPQDGRIRRKIAGKDVDMRVATAPDRRAASASRSVCSIAARVLLGLADIGFATITSTSSASIIQRPHGILLVTGPTGSGKTTTLYACLSEINSPDLNILTVEDPVEYQLEGISQTQVNPKIDLTFAVGPALVPAPGPGRHHGRRDPRPRDRRDRDPGVAHRPPGVLDRPHQRRRRRHHASGRHGDRAVPRRLVAGRPARPAPGAARPCHECREPYRPDRGGLPSSASIPATSAAARPGG